MDYITLYSTDLSFIHSSVGMKFLYVLSISELFYSTGLVSISV